MNNADNDSDPLDERLRQKHGTEPIAPHKANRKNARIQDGRALRCYNRRWKVARFFAWFRNFRRLAVCYRDHAENFLGMLQLGCEIILFL